MSYINNADLASAIKSRQEGKDFLSWIENFGLHLFEKGCVPLVSFQKRERNMMLVLSIRNDSNIPTEKDTISAYLCYFETDDNGFTRFCVNAACDEDVEGLKDFEEAKWRDQSTINWWNEVFCDGKYSIVDEDTLRRKEVLASDSLKMNMMDFIKKIQEEIRKAIDNLHVDHQKINKVCIVERYAKSLPFQYAISRMFPNANGNIFSFVWKEKKKSWLQNASRFHVPGKLLHATLSTSPQITIGDMLKQGEKGVAVTLPLSKGENGGYGLPTTPGITGSELKWDELIKEDVISDYYVGTLAFKRVQLTMIADGFQRIHVVNHKYVMALLSIKGNKIVAKMKDHNENQLVREEKSQQTTSRRGMTSDTDQGEKTKTVSCKEMVYVIDTNVFLDRPNILDFVPANCKIGLTPKIIDEIDGNKNKGEDLKRKAVQAQKSIYNVNENGNRIIYKEPNLYLLKGLNGVNPDNKILALALTLQKEGYEPIILTSDYGLLASASLNKVKTKKLSELNLLKHKR